MKVPPGAKPLHSQYGKIITVPIAFSNSRQYTVVRPVTFMRVPYRVVDGQLVRPFYQMELLI